MSAALPPVPNLEQLKKQAKDLQRAHRAGDPEARARLGQYLPRLGGLSPDEVAAAAITLQECQHALAAEYGFKDWKLLSTAVGAGFDDLHKLSDHDAQVLMREVDQKDLVAALKTPGQPVREKFLHKNMSARVRGFIEAEIELFDGGDEASQKAQQTILQQVIKLTQAGHITWDGTQTGADEPLYPLHVSDDFFALCTRPLDQLTAADIAGFWYELAEQARKVGILSLEQIEKRLTAPLLREILQLIVDGTEPALIENLMTVRIRTLAHRAETRAQMIVTGLKSTAAGHNPNVIAHLLSAFYDENPPAAPRPDDVTALQLTERCRQKSPDQLDYTGLNALLTDIALVARKEGIIGGLKPLVDGLEGHRGPDAELLRRGLELMLAKESPDRLQTALETQSKARLTTLAAAHRQTLTGAIMVQAGKKPNAIHQAVLEAATP